jgi:4a-hydroxytetrahydrobiopterin dehydratase
MAKLTNEELNTELKNIPGWQLAAGQLKKQYAFKDFVTAIAFVNKVAEIAEQLAHHPDIVINYSRVTLSTSTHSEGSVITMKDVDLARRMEQAYIEMKDQR